MVLLVMTATCKDANEAEFETSADVAGGGNFQHRAIWYLGGFADPTRVMVLAWAATI